jgi:hypothetical protein
VFIGKTFGVEVADRVCGCGRASDSTLPARFDPIDQRVDVPACGADIKRKIVAIREASK